MNKEQREKKLSPSRVDAKNTCSWSYWCNYHLKLPNFENDGSRRGSIIHDLYECFTKHKVRHFSKFSRILENEDSFSDPVVARFLKWKANKVGLILEKKVVNKNKTALISNKDFLNSMILSGMRNDFYNEETEEEYAELLQDLRVVDKDKGIDFAVKGLIDKVRVFRDDNDKIIKIEIIDYKSNKQKFDQAKMGFNMQGAVYQMFAKNLYPDVEDISMKFIFLQFDKNPSVEVPKIPDEVLDGIKVYLNEVYKQINNFSEIDAKKNFGKFNGNHYLCGKNGYKFIYDPKTRKKTPTDEPHWKCPYKDAFDYYSVVDSSGKIIKSYQDGEEIHFNPEKGEVIKKMKYLGCPAFKGSDKYFDNFMN